MEYGIKMQMKKISWEHIEKVHGFLLNNLFVLLLVDDNNTVKIINIFPVY